jgi:transcriptional regulator with XRE-family HTH domain
VLSWTQADLAKAASVGVVTVRQFEGESGTPRPATLTDPQQALEAAGLEFIPENGGGAGIRFRKRKDGAQTIGRHTIAIGEAGYAVVSRIVSLRCSGATIGPNDTSKCKALF